MVTRPSAGATFAGDSWRKSRAIFQCIGILNRIHQRSHLPARQSITWLKAYLFTFMHGDGDCTEPLHRLVKAFLFEIPRRTLRCFIRSRPVSLGLVAAGFTSNTTIRGMSIPLRTIVYTVHELKLVAKFPDVFRIILSELFVLAVSIL